MRSICKSSVDLNILCPQISRIICCCISILIISKASSSDLTGGFRSDTREDLHECENLRHEMFVKLEGLKGTIASLVVLDSKDVERAATSNAVWHLMNRNLTRPFVVGLMLVDIVLHITLMLVSTHSRVFVVGILILIYNYLPLLLGCSDRGWASEHWKCINSRGRCHSRASCPFHLHILYYSQGCGSYGTF